MWIEHQAAADADSPIGTTAIIHAELTDGERVSFNANGKAQVPRDVGEALCDHYESIVPAGDAASADADADSDTDTSEGA